MHRTMFYLCMCPLHVGYGVWRQRERSVLGAAEVPTHDGGGFCRPRSGVYAEAAARGGLRTLAFQAEARRRRAYEAEATAGHRLKGGEGNGVDGRSSWLSGMYRNRLGAVGPLLVDYYEQHGLMYPDVGQAGEDVCCLALNGSNVGRLSADEAGSMDDLGAMFEAFLAEESVQHEEYWPLMLDEEEALEIRRIMTEGGFVQQGDEADDVCPHGVDAQGSGGCLMLEDLLSSSESDDEDEEEEEGVGGDEGEGRPVDVGRSHKVWSDKPQILHQVLDAGAVKWLKEKVNSVKQHETLHVAVTSSAASQSQNVAHPNRGSKGATPVMDHVMAVLGCRNDALGTEDMAALAEESELAIHGPSNVKAFLFFER